MSKTQFFPKLFILNICFSYTKPNFDPEKFFLTKRSFDSSLHRNIAQLHEKQTLTEYSFCGESKKLKNEARYMTGYLVLV